MDRSLKIALLVDALEVGGVETFLFRLYAYLRDAGHLVTVVCCGRRGAWWEYAQSLGIRCVCLPSSASFSRFHHALSVGRYLAAEAYDCVLLNHSLYSQASLGMVPDRVVAIPIIHNDLSSVYAVACANSDAWNVAVGVAPKVAAAARALLPNKPILCIPHGVEVPSPAAYGGRAPLDGALRMLFVGRICHDHKGVFYLPEIVKRCRSAGVDATLTVIGEGVDLDVLRLQIQDTGVSDVVECYGQLQFDEIYRQMLQHHILLMPSHFEGFGLVLLESQACGCVPIASRLPGITDKAVDDGVTGVLVDVGDVDGFVEAVVRFYRNSSMWRAMSEQANVRIKSEASLGVMGAAYLDLIHRAVAGEYPLHHSRRSLPHVDMNLLGWRGRIPSTILAMKNRFRSWARRCLGDRSQRDMRRDV